MENEKLDNRKYVFVPFNDNELSLINKRFSIFLYFPYERMSKDKSSLRYMLHCVPFFMQSDEWKFVCSGISMYIDKIKKYGITEYGCDVYLNGAKYVDGKVSDHLIKSSHFHKTDWDDLVDELLSIISEYKLFIKEHRVEHISI